MYSKLEYIFCTFKSQCKGIVKNADSDHAYNRIENEVVNLIEAEDFPADVSDAVARTNFHKAVVSSGSVARTRLDTGGGGVD